MQFNKNVGSMDKTIRIIIGAVLLGWGILGVGPGGAVGIAVMVVGAVLLLTGLFNFCPLFKLLGISSAKS